MSSTFAEQPGLVTDVTLAEDINISATYGAIKGVMLSVDTSSGLAYKATDSATRTVVGFNLDKHYSGDALVPALKRIYRLNNSTSAPIAVKDAGKVAYVENSTTVAVSGTAVAGTIMGVDTSGVFVWVGVAANVK
jgi:hypothetical protein